MVRPLEYTDYSKEMARKVNIEKLGWKDPGGHHHESIFTKFFSLIIFQKFNIDKRKRELSAEIRWTHISKSSIKIIAKPYPVEDGIVEYVINKLGLSQNEFQKIMNAEVKSFLDYNTYYPLIQILDFL